MSGKDSAPDFGWLNKNAGRPSDDPPSEPNETPSNDEVVPDEPQKGVEEENIPEKMPEHDPENVSPSDSVNAARENDDLGDTTSENVHLGNDATDGVESGELESKTHIFSGADLDAAPPPETFPPHKGSGDYSESEEWDVPIERDTASGLKTTTQEIHAPKGDLVFGSHTGSLRPQIREDAENSAASQAKPLSNPFDAAAIGGLGAAAAASTPAASVANSPFSMSSASGSINASRSPFGQASTTISSDRLPAVKQEAQASIFSSKLFVILASYASVITIGFLMLLAKELNETLRPHHLESLPDIPAEKVENLSWVPANAQLPAGHTVSLGESRRFGNVLVEPVKITSGLASFEHYSHDPKKTRSDVGPVWKLWLKVTNVSNDQTIAPLDRKLVLRWVSKSRQNLDFTNQYIAGQHSKSKTENLVQLYRLPVASEWDFQGQDLGRELKPGESYTTYLVSNDEGFEALGEDLIWRVQIRKGYSEKGHGVTTVFEVPFLKSKIASSTI